LFHHLRVVYLLVGTLSIFYIINLSSIFIYVDRFIYNKISPYIYSKDKKDSYILVDANGLEDKQLKRLISIISKNNPKIVIADIFHYHNIDNIYTTPIVTLAILKSIQVDAQWLSKYHILRYHLYNSFYYKSNSSNFYLINFNHRINSANIYAKSILNGYIEDTTFNNATVIVSDFNNNYSFNTLLPFKKREFAHQKYLMYLYNNMTFFEVYPPYEHQFDKSCHQILLHPCSYIHFCIQKL